MNGIRSLNAGAPDLRLSGDQTQRGTYTQRRRDQMAYGGIAGLDGRKRYGIGSWFQEKIKDPIKEKFVDPAIDFVTENPLLTAVGGGALLNQFGIPLTGTPGDRMGQNWLGELLGNVVPGGTVDTVIGQGGTGQSIMDMFRPETISNNPMFGGIESLGDYTYGMPPDQPMSDFPFLGEKGFSMSDIAKNAITNKIKKESGLTGLIDAGKNFLFGDTTRTGQEPLNWKIPVAGGLAAGAYTAGQPRDVHPEDTTGINFQTAKEAMADEGQRFKPLEKYVEPSALAAEGGRIGYDNGGIMMASASDSMDEKNQISLKLFGKPVHKLTPDELIDLNEWMEDKAQKWQGAQGGRIGYDNGGISTMMASAVGDESDEIAMELFGKPVKELTPPELDELNIHLDNLQKKFMAQGGRIGAQEGGLMNLGGMEKDYRQEGGFVPIGGQEKADDVPARLSKNEFVFTADAVRNAGGGDIDAGAEVMENLMENLEAGGKVSEDSQGLEGARGMFANAQALEKRII